MSPENPAENTPPRPGSAAGNGPAGAGRTDAPRSAGTSDPGPGSGAAAKAGSPGEAGGQPAVRIRDLRVAGPAGELVHGIDLEIAPGERVGLIGESGSGKSLTAFSVLGLLDEQLSVSGEITIAGSENLIGASEARFGKLRGTVASMVFQEPMTALNPLMRVGDQVAETMLVHGTVSGRAAAHRKAVELLDQVRLPDPPRISRSYPHQLSGGQRQRVVLAIALANDPAVLIADEPTTALDVTVQAQVLELMAQLVRERGSSLLFISHDLAVVGSITDRVAVMKDGEIVESGPVREVFTAQRHPYTRALLEASDLSGEVLGDAASGARSGSAGDTAGTAPPVTATSTGGAGTAATTSGTASAAAGRDTSADEVHDRVATPRQTPVAGVRAASAPAAAPAAPGTGPEHRWDGDEVTGERIYNQAEQPLIRARGVSRLYRRGVLSSARTSREVKGLDDVSFDIAPGQQVGLVGESGSGKSTLIRQICALDTPTSGEIEIAGITLRDAEGREAGRKDLHRIREQVSIVFQDPMASLDPRMRVRQIVAEPLIGVPKAEAAERAAEALSSVGLGADALDRFPHQFSGGQRQRIGIARALVTRPKILVADEPVSALDVSVRGQVLDLIAELARENNLTLLFISHDMSVVRHICDRVMVMSAGRIVEAGPTEEVYSDPRHEFTRKLIDATPNLAEVLHGA
ncbi:dipeptide ABC transporter ATP-binding protein [Sediminivirga luteola]|uniref:ABC transporter domain-containing protein n=1 Tax=Sediminivirga luteola TaxID=1774748 RepID=A0A8J2TW79_9MICO|nr:ABC transporter ATP-binding protein [Sediminivirga luteola]MCI2264480.1 ABC transporter ATP-binding protein [Sediminivirga luteola]GGA06506.1 hypothetical protein GCM10011333_06850 [Sediminivirga luteola]